MTMFLAWQGSEVRQVEAIGDALLVRFSAASARRGATDHFGHGDEGFLASLTVVFTTAHAQGDLSSAIGSLAEGVLLHEGQSHRHLALPFSLADGVEAELVFRNGTVLQIQAASASCALGEDKRFFESMAC
ncbi:MAG TPA: hypothetical protein H9903_15235 [Candidatus Aquabacterium excrementipullorum]|nr:hypothetical protein [Candidatus Aquabacterium excrementipullorum]